MSYLKKSIASCLGIGIALLVASSPAIAAKRVVLKYKILRESVSVEELTQFTKTGEASKDLKTYLRLSRQNPQTVQQTLTRPIKVNPVLLDRVLNTPVGDAALDQLGQGIQTPKGGAERQALRAALVLSASGDGAISIIEILQNYPTEDVVLDGDRIEGAYRQLNDFVDRLRPLERILR